MFNWLSTMLDRIFAVIFAITLMQCPLFMEQYSIRLSGHVNEVTYQVKEMEKVARGSGKTLDQYIEKFSTSHDGDFSQQGKLMEAMVSRRERLANALSAIMHANVFTRPFIFLFKSDWDIVHATANNYQIGLSLSLESAIYAFIGLVLGYYTYQFLSLFFSRVFQGLKRAYKREISSQPK